VAAAGSSSPEAPSRGRPEEGDATPPWGHPEADKKDDDKFKGGQWGQKRRSGEY